MDDKDLYAGMPLPDALKDAPAGSSQPANAQPGTPGQGGEAPAPASNVSVAAGFAFLEKAVVFQQQQQGQHG
jgi:hypothetical protein